MLVLTWSRQGKFTSLGEKILLPLLLVYVIVTSYLGWIAVSGQGTEQQGMVGGATDHHQVPWYKILHIMFSLSYCYLTLVLCFCFVSWLRELDVHLQLYTLLLSVAHF